ncbi:DUF1844 domain-containing protein [Candidatus Magnetomoraceae bacterium gMMP-15]
MTDEKNKQSDQKSETQLPKVNFATFVMSLSSSALVLLGKLENPGEKNNEQNIQMAKQTIDILGMLQEKTKGNLLDEEETLLQNILTELRILYVGEINK